MASTLESAKETMDAKANIGKLAELNLTLRNNETLIVAVRILDVTRQFGKLRYIVSPVLSKEKKRNKTTVNADKLNIL